MDIDALPLVKDQQIKSETIGFLSAAIRPDQQVLLFKRLGDEGGAETDLALASLPKPKSDEAASILNRNRFEDEAYLDDA